MNKRVPKFTAVVSLAGEVIMKEAFEGRTLNVAANSDQYRT
jgi:hypothetical protein